MPCVNTKNLSHFIYFDNKNFLLRIKMPLSKNPRRQKEIDKMQREFIDLDADGDGTITVQELGNVLRSMRVKLQLSEADIKRILKNIDKDGDGTINLKEYFASMNNQTDKNVLHRVLVLRSKARKQFKKFDKDGSGYITADELKLVYEERTGREVTIAQVEEMLKEADRNCDGKINYEEFAVMMTK